MVIIMSKINPLSTLFIGIDVSSRSNVVYAMDFEQNKLLSGSFPNNQPGAEKLEDEIRKCMLAHQNLNTIVATLESTSVYSIHIANFLSSSEVLMPFSPYVYCINPKMTANYRKSFVGLSKTDPLDSFLIADFARVGRVKNCTPWRGSQFLALKRLTRHRLHLAECITREKTYMISNLYLKFSELELLDDDQQPFSNIFGATSSAVLTEFFSSRTSSTPQKKIYCAFAEKSHNRISDLSKTSELLKKVARDSFRLDKCMAEPLTLSLASSFNCINAYDKEIKAINQAIEKTIKGMNPNAFQILQSIPGVGPVFAAGILAEIGDISAFHSDDALAKYAGLTWRNCDSGDFVSEETPVFRAGNTYLRYFIGEATNSARRYIPEYGDYYAKKFAEVPKHQHKRALALTSRKFVRLVFGLLVKTNCTPAKNWTPNRIMKPYSARFKTLNYGCG